MNFSFLWTVSSQAIQEGKFTTADGLDIACATLFLWQECFSGTFILLPLLSEQPTQRKPKNEDWFYAMGFLPAAIYLCENSKTYCENERGNYIGSISKQIFNMPLILFLSLVCVRSLKCYIIHSFLQIVSVSDKERSRSCIFHVGNWSEYKVLLCVNNTPHICIFLLGCVGSHIF